jgi:hypothetical protein
MLCLHELNLNKNSFHDRWNIPSWTVSDKDKILDVTKLAIINNWLMMKTDLARKPNITKILQKCFL